MEQSQDVLSKLYVVQLLFFELRLQFKHCLLVKIEEINQGTNHNCTPFIIPQKIVINIHHGTLLHEMQMSSNDE